MYYSKSTKGFYDDNIHGAIIPADAAKISDSEYEAAINGQAQGLKLVADANGKPIPTMPPPKSQTEIDNDASDIAKANLTKLRADAFPAMLAYIATKPDAPQALKDMAAAVASESENIKSIKSAATPRFQGIPTNL